MANAGLGGDSAARGIVIGMLLGAAHGKSEMPVSLNWAGRSGAIRGRVVEAGPSYFTASLLICMQALWLDELRARPHVESLFKKIRRRRSVQKQDKQEL